MKETEAKENPVRQIKIQDDLLDRLQTRGRKDRDPPGTKWVRDETGRFQKVSPE